MSLLDPTAISDPDHYTPEDFRSKGLVIRRFKKDIRDQVSADFQERETTCLREKASALEEAAYRALLEVRFTQGGQHKAGRQQELQRIGMQKALFSSPKAALESTQRRIALLQGKHSVSDDERTEVTGLDELRLALQALVDDPSAKSFSRYQKLLELLRSTSFGWAKDDANDRLVIFSERIETLNWLRERLAADLQLKPKQLEVLHGGMADTEQQALVERFGRLDDPLRVLVCSDVASEGLNLHYFCHRLVHFDLPWSLMTFQQRNGRVDRYGQKHRPHIVYLFTEAVTEKIRGDLRILEILEQKDEQANFNLGDPSAFLNVYDPDKEVEKVSDYMAGGMTPEQVEAALDHAAAAKGQGGDANEGANEADYLLELFGGGDAAAYAATQPAGNSLNHIDEPATLFDSEYHYAKSALTQLNQGQTLCQWTSVDAERLVSLTAPRDLQERLRQLPREVQAENDYYALTADSQRMADAIEAARQARAEEETWPKLHYLWPQHPIVEWLGDRVLTHFGRHCAPLLQSVHLQPGEQAFVLMGLVPNRKGQPLLVEWQVAHRKVDATGQGEFTLQPFDAFAARTGLKAGKLPNRGQLAEGSPAVQAMQGALPKAVAAMRGHMVAKQTAFSAGLDERLRTTLAELERLQGRQVEQLTLDLERQLETVKRGRFEHRKQQINRVFDDYRQWVHDTLTTEPQPWIQVLAAVTSAGA
jgi:superfamily II DNA/RNA helicase